MSASRFSLGVWLNCQPFFIVLPPDLFFIVREFRGNQCLGFQGLNAESDVRKEVGMEIYGVASNMSWIPCLMLIWLINESDSVMRCDLLLCILLLWICALERHG